MNYRAKPISMKRRREYLDKYCEVVLHEGKEGKDVINTKEGVFIVAVDSLAKLIHDGDKIFDHLVKYEINEVYTTKSVANYGYSEAMKGWWAWDAKDIAVFFVGTIVDSESGAYVPENKYAFEEYWRRFWRSELYDSVTITERREDGFTITCLWSTDPTIVKNPDARGRFTTHSYDYPKEYGRGKWEAKTLDDAKQMAIDFANNQLL